MAQTSVSEMDLSRPTPRHANSHAQSVSRVSTTGYNETEARLLGDISIEQQELDLLGPVYVLERTEENQGCCCYSRRRRLHNAEQLRATIPQESRHGRRPVLVIQGFPVDYVQVLRDLLGVDARFVEAHVNRRVYRPLTRRRRNGAAAGNAFACLDYPELLTWAKESAISGEQINPGVAGESPVHAISPHGDMAMFCRVSLWMGSKADVLFLDRPAWTQHSSDFRKAQYRSSDTSYASAIAHANGASTSSNTLYNGSISQDEEIPSFETLLYESLSGEHDEDIDIMSLVEDIALHQWTEFFEALSTDLLPGAIETTALYWQTQKSLERNLSSSELHDNFLPTSSPSSSKSQTQAWQSLLSRLTRHTSLLTQLNPPTTNIQLVPEQAQDQSPPLQTPITPTNAPPPPLTNRRRRRHHRRGDSSTPNDNNNADEQNKHSLDRVSYMGGVLLPLSIVSSILSMSDPFNPGGGMFYVFWAASVPLVCGTVLIIYADSIRKAEVWIEVASSASGGGGGGSSSGRNSSSSCDNEDWEKKKKNHGSDDVEAGVGRRRIQAVPYLETVTIDPVPGAMNRMARTTAVVDEEGEEEEEEEESGSETFDGPGMMVEKLFKDAGDKKWRKEQLGWMGACKTALRIYKLKKGRPPPNWVGTVRRGNTA
ncbi:hypothetical protein M426DRAFT_23758 [Hypoxylon sp. CI-4A]|nr:hypothetical protein M426DRAFT_23758 [Hypoxylon sp. CI-4A]